MQGHRGEDLQSIVGAVLLVIFQRHSGLGSIRIYVGDSHKHIAQKTEFVIYVGRVGKKSVIIHRRTK